MSSHVFHEIFLHLNWHTKLSRPMLVPDLELQVHDFLRSGIRQMGDVFLHEIGGTSTHVHLAIQIDPDVTISTLVGDLKGASAFYINRQLRRKALAWQRGFGVVSFGKRQLPWVSNYVRNQKVIHEERNVAERLERITRDDDGRPWSGQT